MAYSQIINDLMANLRRSHSVKRERSSLVLLRSILTSSSSFGTHKTTPSDFLLHYPALMDPRNFLRLITKYSLKEILIWANSGRKVPVVNGPNIHELSKKVIELMGERTPGGEDTLNKIIEAQSPQFGSWFEGLDRLRTKVIDEHTVRVRDREITTRLTRESLAGTKVPRVALPRYRDAGDMVRFWRRENLPGFFPFTAGVFRM